MAGNRDERRDALKGRIRAAARELFAERGFDDAGVREIAAAVGVNPAIVIRHFGSKEALFLETMAFDGDLAGVLDGPIESAGRAIVASVLDAGDRSWRVFAALIGASARPEVIAQLRRSFDEGLGPRLIPRLEGDDAALRAHLFVAQLTGLLTAFAVYGDEHIAGASREAIVELYGDSMQALLTPGGSAPSPRGPAVSPGR